MSPTCTASRDPAPSCGTANITYANGTTTYGTDTFCASGDIVNPNPPAFPVAGATVTWTCQSPNG